MGPRPDIGADAEALAVAAGLVYVSDEAQGIGRIRRGKGFTYVDGSGDRVSDSMRTWIEQMVIPPAWSEVWISKRRDGHILATGRDSAGRKQYVYHPAWEEIRDEVKFTRMEVFGRRLARLRRKVDSALRSPGLSREKVTALSIAVLDRTLIRVGNQRYADSNDAYGLTTLTCDHVSVDGRHVHLDFSGKGGADHQVVFADRRLATLISRCQEMSGETLFSYERPEGTAGTVTSDALNSLLSDWLQGRFTAKDFRTWGASASVTGRLLDGPGGGDPESEILEAVDFTAERLGNTREVCRSSYLHPGVLEAYRTGDLHEAWAHSRQGRWLSRSESTVNRALATKPSR